MGESKLVILVAGGVSAPGRLLCNRLASAGHILFAGYPSPQWENIEYEAGVTPLALDISSDNSVAAAITQITKATQRIDIVINNARTALFGALEAVHICDAENFINEMLIGRAPAKCGAAADAGTGLWPGDQCQHAARRYRGRVYRLAERCGGVP